MAVTTEITNGGQPLLYFEYQNQFWMLIGDGFLSRLAMWASPDGVNWTRQGLNQSTGGTLPAACYDSTTQTVTVWLQPGFSLPGFYLLQFDLATATWGAPFGAQGFFVGNNASPVFIAPYPPSNGFIVVYGTGDIVSFNLPVYAQVWDGSSWGTPIHISVNAEALAGFNNFVFFGAITAVLDGASVLHVIFNTRIAPGGPPTWQNRFFYQELSAGGALQNFQEFPGQSGTPEDIWPMNSQPGANLFVDGATLLWGIQRFNQGTDPNPYPSIYKGTPLVNPVWTEVGNIDPTNVAPPTGGWFPIFQLGGGGQIYANWVNGFQVRAAISSNGFASFTNATLIDNGGIGGLPRLTNTGALIVFGTQLSFATGAIINEGSAPVYWTGPALNPAYPIKITLRGFNRRQCGPTNVQVGEIKQSPHVKSAV